MHKVLELLQAQLTRTAQAVQTGVPGEEPLGIAHGNWSFPNITRAELVEEAVSIAKMIKDGGVDDLGEHEAAVEDYVRRLQFLQQHTVPQIWGSAAQAVPAYMFTLMGLRKALVPVLRKDEHAEAVVNLKKLTAQLRGMAARLNALEPRTTPLAKMVEDIERAHTAADQLPTDLEALGEARRELKEIIKQSTIDHGSISDMRGGAQVMRERLEEYSDEARIVLERCETAYSAATSVGLAAAFSERSDSLSKSMWFWVFGLVSALAIGGIFGTSQLKVITELLTAQNASSPAIVFNISLAVLSVGAPIWFAWLSTKQIGQRFRLSEDYAYKASISRAYEGFRREAARIDANMEAKLLASALARLDEIPLRLVETVTHGSPWHELASSDLVKRALMIVPGFGEKVEVLASKSIESLKPSKSTTIPKPSKDSE